MSTSGKLDRKTILLEQRASFVNQELGQCRY
jgi:hypothetical protein